jgi:hypothetical protein
MVSVAQLVEPRVVIPVVVGSSPIVHPNPRFGRSSPRLWVYRLRLIKSLCKISLKFNNSTLFAKVAELVDALDLGSSGVTREGSSPSFRTTFDAVDRTP